MTEGRRTSIFVLAAVLLVAAAWLARPRSDTTDAVGERGQRFFPEFTDPNRAASLEVVEFDEQTSAARPFKVMNREGRWTIPSHQDYPADGATRLSSVAAAVIALEKDDVVSDNVSDHERCGVLDPLDETLPTPRGRGTRITVRGANDVVLADIITGHPVDGRPHLRYVRRPGERRVYVARLDNLQVSTRFEDWIEPNLLLVDRSDIDQIGSAYTAMRRPGGSPSGTQSACAARRPDVWEADGVPAGSAIDTFTMNLLVTKLVELSIVDVREAARRHCHAQPRRRARLSAADVRSSRAVASTSRRMAACSRTRAKRWSTPRRCVLRPEVRRAGVGRPARTGISSSRSASIRVRRAAPSVRGPCTPRAALGALRTWYYVISDDSFRKIRLERQELIKSRAARRRVS